ncbi:MAG TPA: response regulator [Candidatus Hydrogenedentes bacterium]|nr:response regulator [Candidatus Hydrogenedentota bacterium]
MLKTLIVDDVPQNGRVLKALMAKYGDCDIALNGREAVNAFQNAWKQGAPYQLVCMDIMLPDIDGLKVVEVLRKMEEAMKVEESQRVKIIIVSSLDDSPHRLKAYNLECAGYITKPISSKDLVECLKQAKLI